MTYKFKTLAIALAGAGVLALAAPALAATTLQTTANPADVQTLKNDINAAVAAAVLNGGTAADIQAAIEKASALDGFDALTLKAALALVSNSTDPTDLAKAIAAETPLVTVAANDEIAAAQAASTPGSPTASVAAATYAAALSSANSGGGYVTKAQ